MIFVYLVSILSGILLGTTESINKNITEKRYSVFSYFFIQTAGNQLLYLIPFLKYGTLPKDLIAYFYVLIIVILIFLGNTAIIKAYKTDDLSDINILSRISLVIGFLSGVLLLKESINLYNITGITLIILGILTIFYERKFSKPSIGLLYAFSGGICFGLVAYFIKLTLRYFNTPSYLFTYGVFTLVILLFIPKTYQDIKPIFNKYKKKIMISRITAVSAIYLFIWSIQNANISIVNTNYETAFLITAVFIGILFLNERKHIAKKLAGSLLCTLGIVLLNFF